MILVHSVRVLILMATMARIGYRADTSLHQLVGSVLLSLVIRPDRLLLRIDLEYMHVLVIPRSLVRI